MFDCDGTLVDSQVNIVRAMRQAFQALGMPTPRDHAIRHCVGLSLAEIMGTLMPHGDAALHADLVDAYRKTYHAMRAAGTLAVEPLYPGISNLLVALQTAGWALGVATGKSDRGLALILAHHDITHHFTTLQTADRHPSKPHPAMLEQAMVETGAAPAETVMIGDTAFDMAMAVSAGARAVGVDWGYHSTRALRTAGAQVVVSDAAELSKILI